MYLTFVVKGLNVEHEALIGSECIGMTKDCLVFRTAYSNLEKIAAWFADTPPIIPGQGFPNGTCLVYSIHEGEA
jgi:hypothetical protein